jgi:hypothetical protein
VQGTDIILTGGVGFMLFLCARLVAAACLPEAHWLNRGTGAGWGADDEADRR